MSDVEVFGDITARFMSGGMIAVGIQDRVTGKTVFLSSDQMTQLVAEWHKRSPQQEATFEFSDAEARGTVKVTRGGYGAWVEVNGQACVSIDLFDAATGDDPQHDANVLLFIDDDGQTHDNDPIKIELRKWQGE